MLKLGEYRQEEGKENPIPGQRPAAGSGQGAAARAIDTAAARRTCHGLDPAGIVEVREMLLDLSRNKGVTVFISSHILEEISKLATRIGIIHRGAWCRKWTAAKLESLLYKRLALDRAGQAWSTDSSFRRGYKIPHRGGRADRSRLTPGRWSIPEEIANMLVHAGFPPRAAKS